MADRIGRGGAARLRGRPGPQARTYMCRMRFCSHHERSQMWWSSMDQAARARSRLRAGARAHWEGMAIAPLRVPAYRGRLGMEKLAGAGLAWPASPPLQLLQDGSRRAMQGVRTASWVFGCARSLSSLLAALEGRSAGVQCCPAPSCPVPRRGLADVRPPALVAAPVPRRPQKKALLVSFIVGGS